MYRDRETGRTSVTLTPAVETKHLNVVFKSPLAHRVMVEALNEVDAEHTALALIYDYRKQRDQ